MGPFEYLLIFAAVILGLAISDIAVSIHRLLNAGSRVRWDWLAPLAAALAFERIVTQWWVWYGGRPIAQGMTYAMFVGILISALLLFLMSAAALPDELPENQIDLRCYYHSISRRYWLLFAAQWAVMNGVSTWAQITVAHARMMLGSPLYLILPAALALAYFRTRWLQAVGLIGFLALYTIIYFKKTLS
jgi:hypothetical protein